MSELVKKRSNIINQFPKRNIIRKSEDFFDAPEKFTEGVTEEKSKKESDQSIPVWVKVSEERFNLIKEVINKDKNLGTSKDNERYILKDANDLVIKTAKKERLARTRPLTFIII